jgi:hypothetical protein
MFLADAAERVAGKVDVKGAGWYSTGPGPSDFVVVVLLEMPMALAVEPTELRLELVDDHGALVNAADDTPLVVGPLTIPGSPEAAPDVNAASLHLIFLITAQLPTGRNLEWRLWLNGDTRTDWRVGFRTAPEGTVR